MTYSYFMWLSQIEMNVLIGLVKMLSAVALRVWEFKSRFPVKGSISMISSKVSTNTCFKKQNKNSLSSFLCSPISIRLWTAPWNLPSQPKSHTTTSCCSGLCSVLLAEEVMTCCIRSSCLYYPTCCRVNKHLRLLCYTVNYRGVFCSAGITERWLSFCVFHLLKRFIHKDTLIYSKRLWKSFIFLIWKHHHWWM